MKKYNYSLIIMLLVVSSILTSCKKSSMDLDNNTYLLTKKSWTIVSIRQYTNNIGWTDLYSNFPNCRKDDKLFFFSNSLFNWDEGLTKCNPLNQQSFNEGTWSFQANQSKLQTEFNGTKSIVDISLLDNDNLITTIFYSSGSDTTITESKYNH